MGQEEKLRLLCCSLYDKRENNYNNWVFFFLQNNYTLVGLVVSTKKKYIQVLTQGPMNVALIWK